MSPQVALAMVFVFGGSDVPPKADPAAKVQTICGCGTTGVCSCWESQCSCSACGRGVAAKAPKASSSAAVGTNRTPARDADTPALPDKAPGSYADSTATGLIRIGAQSTGQLGVTSGCANGQCASPSRGRIFRR